MAAIFTRNRYIGWCVLVPPPYPAFHRSLCKQLKQLTRGQNPLPPPPKKNRASVVFSIQSWLGESEETTKTTATPGYFTIGMSLMALGVTYLPLFLPPPPGTARATGTEAPAPAPPA